MTRLRLLALSLLVGAAPPGVEPSGSAIVAEAKAFLPVSCKASKPTCAQAGEILNGYLAELAKADACAAKACPVADIHTIFDRDHDLDKLEHALPAKARSAGGRRPFLRLSLLVVGRSGLALALSDPKANAPTRYDPPVDAPKMVELICTKYADKCARAGGILSTAGELGRKASACAKTACAFPVHEAMAISAETVTGDYLELSNEVDAYTLPIFGLVREARALIAQNMGRVSGAKLAELEGAEKDLHARVSVLSKNPGDGSAAEFDELNARGGKLVAMYQEASIGSDRTLALMADHSAAGSMRERVNAAAGRLASARAQLAMIKAKRGFGGSSAIQTSYAGTAGGGKPLLVGGDAPRAPGKVLLDRRAMPRPPPDDPDAPPIIDKKLTFLDILANTGSADDAEMVDAKRRLNLTRTIGDPSGRAKFVHTQKANDTCAIVAQQGILLAHGLLPKGDPAAQEAALAAEAKARGFYRQGTHDAYTADLLVDRGLIVAKQSKAPLETLDAAVRRGGMIIANVDARGLWGVKGPNVMGHAIVITGAEVGRFDDKTLGYYINDSGTAVVGAGRFIPIAQFKKAWDIHTRTFAEVK